MHRSTASTDAQVLFAFCYAYFRLSWNHELPGLGQSRAPAGFMSLRYVLDLRNAGWRTGNPATSARKLLEGHPVGLTMPACCVTKTIYASPKPTDVEQTQNGLPAHQHSFHLDGDCRPSSLSSLHEEIIGFLWDWEAYPQRDPKPAEAPQSRSEASETFRTSPKNTTDLGLGNVP